MEIFWLIISIAWMMGNKFKEDTPIGGNDLWIACHALSCDAVLVTHNTKEFQRITDLKWQDWTI